MTVAGALASGTSAHAQWSVTALHPAGTSPSIAFATVGVQRASLWSGSEASWVDLNPAGSTDAGVFATGGGEQAGYAYVGGMGHASLWGCTATSWVNLDPLGSTYSAVLAISGDLQAGIAEVGGEARASLWNAKAASWVDLSVYLPSGFTQSVASGTITDGVNTYVCGYALNTESRRSDVLVWTQHVPVPGAAAMGGIAAMVAARRRRCGQRSM